MHGHIFFHVRKLLLCDIWKKKEEEETKILLDTPPRRHPCLRTQIRPSVRGHPTLTGLSLEPLHPFLISSSPSHFHFGYSLAWSSSSQPDILSLALVVNFLLWPWLSYCTELFPLVWGSLVTPRVLHPAGGMMLPTVSQLTHGQDLESTLQSPHIPNSCFIDNDYQSFSSFVLKPLFSYRYIVHTYYQSVHAALFSAFKNSTWHQVFPTT